MYLDYDVNLLYQSFSRTMLSLWPIIAPAFAILLVGLLLGGIIAIFRRWQEG